MRSTAVRKLLIAPIPAARIARPKLPQIATTTTSSSSAAAAENSSTPSAPPRPAALVDQLLQQQTAQGDAWPPNLRVERHLSAKQLYWKVPTQQREELRKLLREK